MGSSYPVAVDRRVESRPPGSHINNVLLAATDVSRLFETQAMAIVPLNRIDRFADEPRLRLC